MTIPTDMGAEGVKPCWPWHLWWLVEGPHPRGDRCRRCLRDVAVPQDATGRPICIYCALDLGLIPAEEQEFDAAPLQHGGKG